MIVVLSHGKTTMTNFLQVIDRFPANTIRNQNGEILLSLSNLLNSTDEDFSVERVAFSLLTRTRPSNFARFDFGLPQLVNGEIVVDCQVAFRVRVSGQMIGQFSSPSPNPPTPSPSPNPPTPSPSPNPPSPSPSLLLFDPNISGLNWNPLDHGGVNIDNDPTFTLLSRFDIPEFTFAIFTRESDGTVSNDLLFFNFTKSEFDVVLTYNDLPPFGFIVDAWNFGSPQPPLVTHMSMDVPSVVELFVNGNLFHTFNINL